MQRYYMGVDIGTHESKGVLVDENLKIVAIETAEHGLENPKPNYYEHDAEAVWWGDFCKLSNGLIKAANIDAEQIACVGVSALSADVVPVDENCTPLRKAILYGIDARAEAEIEFMQEYYGEERLDELFPDELCSSDCMPKILWIKNNEPDIHEKAYKFLTASSYLTAKLTGRYVIDRYLAISSFAPAYNSDLSIHKEHTEELYCRADQLAEGCETADLVGVVTEAAAKVTGLAAGTPVVTGTDDSGAEAISTGVLKPGRLMVQLGSTCYIMYCSDRPIDEDRLWCGDFLIPGTYCVDGGTNTAGALTSWMRDTVFPELKAAEEATGVNAYETMAELASTVVPGSDGLIVLPYFSGERTPINDADAKGVFFGMTLQHTRAHMMRSVLEGVAYSIAQHVQIMEENGLEIDDILCVGGGTKNREWLQIISDITGHTVRTAKVTIGAAYGDAMIAALGVGRVPNYDALADYIEPGETFQPNEANHEVYKPLMEIYTELYQSTKDLMHRL